MKRIYQPIDQSIPDHPDQPDDTEQMVRVGMGYEDVLDILLGVVSGQERTGYQQHFGVEILGVADLGKIRGHLPNYREFRKYSS